MTEDIDKISFAYDIVGLAMSPFAKLLWPLYNLSYFFGDSTMQCGRPAGIVSF